MECSDHCTTVAGYAEKTLNFSINSPAYIYSKYTLRTQTTHPCGSLSPTTKSSEIDSLYTQLFTQNSHIT